MHMQGGNSLRTANFTVIKADKEADNTAHNENESDEIELCNVLPFRLALLVGIQLEEDE